MATSVRAPEAKSFDRPEEVRPFPKGRLDVVTVGGTLMGRAVFEPGWKWSESVKPIAGTSSCQSAHLGYVISGRMTIAMDDGARLVIGPGEAISLPPGHDAWVEGNEPTVILDFVGFEKYAKPA